MNPAEFAGDAALQDPDAGLRPPLHRDQRGVGPTSAADLRPRARGRRHRARRAAGVHPRPEHASRSRRPPIIGRFKDAGVTSVVVQADPIALATFTQEATPQEYFPEWIIAGVDPHRHDRLRPHLRPAAVGPRLRLQPARRPDRPRVSTARHALRVVLRRARPRPTTATGVLVPAPADLLHRPPAGRAGPDVETLREGLLTPGAERAARSPRLSFSYGDHGLYPGTSRPRRHRRLHRDLVGRRRRAVADELDRRGPGLYRYVDGGQRATGVGEYGESHPTPAFDLDAHGHRRTPSRTEVEQVDRLSAAPS